MGVSTNGILYFGFDFKEEGDEPDLEPAELDKYSKPDVDCHWAEEFYEAEEEFIKRGGAKEDRCSVSGHGHCDYLTLYVSVKGKCARRGYPEKLSKDFFDVSQEEIEKLKRFCKVLGIKWQEPSWHLASYWG